MESDARVEGIFVALEASAPMVPVGEAEALTGRGLAGDRYERGIGYYSDKPGPQREVTLIAAEVLDDLAEHGWKLLPGEHRRNVVVRGMNLDALEGHEFAIGTVRLRTVRPCPPCNHLEQVSGRAGLRAALDGRAGMRAEILVGGVMTVGDRLVIGPESRLAEAAPLAPGAGSGPLATDRLTPVAAPVAREGADASAGR